MDFANISSTLADGAGVPMQIESPDQQLLYARPGGKNDEWELTTDETEFPCLMFMVGQDSKPFRKRKAQMYAEAVKTARKKKNFDEAEHEQLETVASGCTSWEHIVWEGKILEFNEDNLIMFLDKYRPAFDQANTFIVDRSNFFKEASKG